MISLEDLHMQVHTRIHLSNFVIREKPEVQRTWKTCKIWKNAHFKKNSVKTWKSQNVRKAYKLRKSQGIILGQWVLALMLCIPLPIRYCSTFNMVLLINYLSENPLWTMHVRFSFLSVCNEKLAYPFCVTSECVS